MPSTTATNQVGVRDEKRTPADLESPSVPRSFLKPTNASQLLPPGAATQSGSLSASEEAAPADDDAHHDRQDTLRVLDDPVSSSLKVVAVDETVPLPP